MDALDQTELRAVALLTAQMDQANNEAAIRDLGAELADGDPLDTIAALSSICVQLLDALSLALQTPREQLWQQYARSTALVIARRDNTNG